MQKIVETDPKISHWHSVHGQLNIHQSESLLYWIAGRSELEVVRDIKGESGILVSMNRHDTFLRDFSHSWRFITLLEHSSGSFRSKSGSVFWPVGCSNEAHSPLLRTYKPKFSPLATITIE